jgi:PadR family transcriptional regulator, regulatory protein AphA
VPELRLTTTSFVVLGMIALHGHSTPYALKRAIGESVGLFWHFPHAQLYAEPDRLADLGLLARSVEGGGRRRKTYSLTGPGHDALREWLATPTEAHFQLRDVAELKLFFHEIGEPDHLATLAAEQIAQHRSRIGLYDDLLHRTADPAPILELGIELEHAALRFWTALADDDLPRLREQRGNE